MINQKAVAAEFTATTLFVWVGTGSAVATTYLGNLGGGGLVAISLAFGLCISSLAYSIGQFSGGHINPAVTFAFMLLKKLDPLSGIAYIAAQFLGAVVGSLLVWGCFSSLPGDALLGANVVNLNINQFGAFLLEVMGTLLLVFVVLHAAVHPKASAKNAAPIAIGWAVFLAHIVLIPFTGCGINPARSFGPHLVNAFRGDNVWVRGVWVYYTGPFLGSAIGCGLYKYFSHGEDELIKEEE